MRAEKLIRADAKLKNLCEEDLQTLWRLRHPETGGEVMTLEAICVHIMETFGISIALSSLSGFYRWLELKRRLDARADAVEQFKQDLARNGNKSNEEIKRAGQMLFLTEGILEKDDRKFFGAVKMDTDAARLKQGDAKIGLQKEALAQSERKLAMLEAAAAEAKAKLLAVTDAAKSQGGISAETLARIEEAAGLL